MEMLKGKGKSITQLMSQNGMKESSRIIRDMALEYTNMKMETIMRVSGIWTRLVVKECLGIKMEMFILDKLFLPKGMEREK
jgi:hypothetical protein